MPLHKSYKHQAILVLPRIRVQNANAISSPLTWGFPSITAFTGLATALARRLQADTENTALSGIALNGSIGVVCHGLDAQVTEGGYTHSFCLTRNPLLSNGSSAAIVEEGRVHLELTLVLEVSINDALLNDEPRAQCAAAIREHLAAMRIAGGSVMPTQSHRKAHIVLMPDDSDKREKEFKRLARQWLPGFVLVGRDDLLQQPLQSPSQGSTQVSLLNSWLTHVQLTYRAIKNEANNAANGAVEWKRDERKGWLVPIPVGYAALSELHPAGSVAGARDASVPFRFVESVYSIGEWVSPHRLRNVEQILWRTQFDADKGLYRCVNGYRAPVLPSFTDDEVSETDFANWD